MSKVRFFEVMPVKALRHPLWYRIREFFRGNPRQMGHKVILPGDDYGSWSNGFHPAAMPAPIKKAPGDAATSSGSRSKNERTVYHKKERNAR